MGFANALNRKRLGKYKDLGQSQSAAAVPTTEGTAPGTAATSPDGAAVQPAPASAAGGVAPSGVPGCNSAQRAVNRKRAGTGRPSVGSKTINGMRDTDLKFKDDVYANPTLRNTGPGYYESNLKDEGFNRDTAADARARRAKGGVIARGSRRSIDWMKPADYDLTSKTVHGVSTDLYSSFNTKGTAIKGKPRSMAFLGSRSPRFSYLTAQSKEHDGQPGPSDYYDNQAAEIRKNKYGGSKGVVIPKSNKAAMTMAAPITGGADGEGTGGISGANNTLSTSSGWIYNKIQATPGPGAYTPMSPGEFQRQRAMVYRGANDSKMSMRSGASKGGAGLQAPMGLAIPSIVQAVPQTEAVPAAGGQFSQAVPAPSPTEIHGAQQQQVMAGPTSVASQPQQPKATQKPGVEPMFGFAPEKRV